MYPRPLVSNAIKYKKSIRSGTKVIMTKKQFELKYLNKMYYCGKMELVSFRKVGGLNN